MSYFAEKIIVDHIINLFGVKPVFSELSYIDGYGWHMSMEIPGYVHAIEYVDHEKNKIKPHLIEQAFEVYSNGFFS